MRPTAEVKTPRGSAKDARPAVRFHLEDFLPYQLAVLAEVTSEGFAQVYRQRFKLTIPEWRVLATVAEVPQVRAKDVGAARHLPKTAVSRAVASLRRRGLLKVDVNTSDKRESFLSLTAQGRALHAEIVPLAAAYAEDLLGRLSPAERTAFRKAVRKLGAIATPGDGNASRP
jgi:DNA-binding MarR family transcriptional regulator